MLVWLDIMMVVVGEGRLGSESRLVAAFPIENSHVTDFNAITPSPTSGYGLLYAGDLDYPHLLPSQTFKCVYDIRLS